MKNKTPLGIVVLGEMFDAWKNSWIRLFFCDISFSMDHNELNVFFGNLKEVYINISNDYWIHPLKW